MLYFIPAWYKGQNWTEDELCWYQGRAKSEFDDTIKQLQLFQRNMRMDYTILLLSYAPNFRHFLHRQGMFRAPYWSCFDAMMQISRTKQMILSFQNIKWPQGVEFVYSMFAISVYLHDEKYAVVDYGECGNPIRIDMYHNNKINRRNYYDDRGFVSSSVIYEDGNPIYQDYLMENGIWKLREYSSDGHIEVNENYPHYNMVSQGKLEQLTYRKRLYSSMQEIIEEVLGEYINRCNNTDKYFAAMHPLHTELLSRILIHRYVISTFFEDRYPMDRLSDAMDLLDNSDYIITDTDYKRNQLIEKMINYKGKIYNISPYDARFDLGISSNMKVQNILIPVDGLEELEIYRIIDEVSKYLNQNEKARVHFFTRDANSNCENKILDMTEKILKSRGYDLRWVRANQILDEGENKLEEDEKIELRFFVDRCVDERSISRMVNEQRVILDFRKVEDVFLFITAISKGVPRIGLQEDKYLKNGRNGRVLNYDSEIVEALSFYLDSMDNWNAALVACYELGQQYTTDVLITAWKEVMEIHE